jgi:CPA1 family monovalent cation:H+ antiporter
VQLSAETRATAWSVWSMFLFLLNGTVFLLLGLQMPILFEELRDVWWVALAYYAAIVTLLVMALRLLWVFPGAYLPRWLSRRVREREPEPSFKGVFVVGWSGLRGAVTLAAALAIPTHLPGGEPFPSRSFVIFLAGSVIVGTLLVQGLSLPWLVRRLGVRADRELAEEERGARRAVNEAQLARLRTLVERKSAACDPSIAAKIEVELAEGIELLAAPESDSTPAAERRRRERELRAELVAVGRDAALALYREGAVNDEIFRSLQGDLDLAEARLRAL